MTVLASPRFVLDPTTAVLHIVGLHPDSGAIRFGSVDLLKLKPFFEDYRLIDQALPDLNGAEWEPELVAWDPLDPEAAVVGASVQEDDGTVSLLIYAAGPDRYVMNVDWRIDDPRGASPWSPATLLESSVIVPGDGTFYEVRHDRVADVAVTAGVLTYRVTLRLAGAVSRQDGAYPGLGRSRCRGSGAAYATCIFNGAQARTNGPLKTRSTCIAHKPTVVKRSESTERGSVRARSACVANTLSHSHARLAGRETPAVIQP